MSREDSEEECEEIQTVLNIFMIYYNKTENKEKKNENLFQGMLDNSTNRQFNFFAEQMREYNSDKNALMLFNINDQNETKKYILSISEKKIKSCDNLIPILKYLESIDWTLDNWDISSI